jgi:hypothetical protein
MIKTGTRHFDNLTGTTILELFLLNERDDQADNGMGLRHFPIMLDVRL